MYAACVHVCVCACVRACVRACMNMLMYVFVYACACVNLRTYISELIYIWICITFDCHSLIKKSHMYMDIVLKCY